MIDAISMHPSPLGAGLSLLAVTALGGATGAVLGSFIATLVIRWPTSAVAGRSRCDDCSAPIGYAHLIPLLPFLRAAALCLLSTKPTRSQSNASAEFWLSITEVSHAFLKTENLALLGPLSLAGSCTQTTCPCTGSYSQPTISQA